ncbi:hypothetical protein BLOT_001036 [Blomia tropicalis]|nr:hypothetical protein BLOT_001036 [Blomia tropicalis]
MFICSVVDQHELITNKPVFVIRVRSQTQNRHMVPVVCNSIREISRCLLGVGHRDGQSWTENGVFSSPYRTHAVSKNIKI